MNFKILLCVVVIILTFGNYTSAQNSSGKINKTNQDLKKTKDIVNNSKALLGKLFKNKNKSNNPNDSLVDSIDKEESPETQPQVALSKEASILFKKVKSKTSNTEKNDIAKALSFKVVPDGEKFHFADDDYLKEYTFDVYVYPLDINKDGIEEIVTVYGHMAIWGDSSVSTLFIKDKLGNYQSNFGFPGSLIILQTKGKSFPDIAIGGPGFTFPVWSWNGSSYNMSKKITDKEMEALNPLFIENESKLYCDALKI